MPKRPESTERLPVPGFSARYVPAFDLAAAAVDVREAAQRLSKKL